MMKTLIAVVAAGWLLAACNTMEGLGKDVQKAGQTVEEAAKKK